MKRVAIPVGNGLDAAEAVKQNLDMVTGQQKNATVLKPLDSTASLADVITQLNAILARIQGDT